MLAKTSQKEVKSNNKLKSNEEITFLAAELCLYSVVKRSASSLGWTLIDESAPDKVKKNCDVIWVDRSFANDKLFLTLQRWQRINHFPGMTNICRKTRLAQNLELMRQKFPREYSFFPVTFILPHNFAALKSMFVNGRSKQPFIIKPDGAAQGKGIFLTKRLADVQDLQMSCVAQQYIKNPLLIDNKKFDLRIYLLVMSCFPLRLYLFRDGLVRMCTEEYHRPNSSNMTDRCMHLTNYAVNKRSKKYERETGDKSQSSNGSKRSICWLLNWLGQERGEDKAKEMWSKIGDICVMSVLSILPTLQREYTSTWREINETNDESRPSQCFEILGIDIMIDRMLRPHLIEVNHLPSWGTDSPLDDAIKSQVITQALKAINVKANDRWKYSNTAKKQSHIRLCKPSAVHTNAAEDVANSNNKVAIGDIVSDAKRRQPSLFESNSAERRIHAIYTKHAPEKLEKLPALLKKFRGYEEWLVMRVTAKYEKNQFDSDKDSSDEDSDCSPHNQEQMYVELRACQKEECILEGYDRIYPPKGHGRISLSRFKEMEEYISEIDAQQQRRLLCPLQQIRQNNDADVSDFVTANIQQQHWNRADGWIGGNIHIHKKLDKRKIIAPPSAKQIEFADRLSQGFSTGSITASKTSLQQTKCRILNNELFFEECSNPLWNLTDRVSEARELSREARRRTEIKLSHRLNPCVALRQKILHLGLSNEQSCLRLENEDKLYSKRRFRQR